MAIASSNITQSNKQVTVVKMNCGSAGKRHTYRKRCYKRRRASCEKVCGSIFQLCDGMPRTYFKSFHAHSSGLVRIHNYTKGTMTATIGLNYGRVVTGTVEQGQQVTFDIPSIRSLTIECTGEGGICKGTYLIKIQRYFPVRRHSALAKSVQQRRNGR
ncbi:S-Ena type endospore appendage [Paenibacillus sp. y28]|uniref:S-Ena type endospore appendage n=1 Tax=Paenibacillus sp. y28 TaxID=3129110 RepID=UPI00301783BA